MFFQGRLSSHHKTADIGLPSRFCPWNMGNFSHSEKKQRSVFVCLFCWHVPCNVIHANRNHTVWWVVVVLWMFNKMRLFLFSGKSSLSPSSTYSIIRTVIVFDIVQWYILIKSSMVWCLLEHLQTPLDLFSIQIKYLQTPSDSSFSIFGLFHAKIPWFPVSVFPSIHWFNAAERLHWAGRVHPFASHEAWSFWRYE